MGVSSECSPQKMPQSSPGITVPRKPSDQPGESVWNMFSTPADQEGITDCAKKVQLTEIRASAAPSRRQVGSLARKSISRGMAL